MLKLERRLLSSFLAPGHQSALKRRRASAATLANQKLSSVEKSRRIGHQWDAFRAGRTSKDTFSMLWAELLDMAFSKCALCESAGPGTVEHLEGKSKTPARAFDWVKLASRLRPLQPLETEHRHRLAAARSERPVGRAARLLRMG